MLLCRFGSNQLGVVRDNNVYEVTEVLSDLPQYSYPFPTHDVLIANLDSLRPRIQQLASQSKPIPLSQIKLLAPVANPGKIIAAPVNYLKHLEEARTDSEIHHSNQVGEIQRVGLFLKATSSLIGVSEPVQIAHPNRRNDHEAEVVVVIGKAGRNISAKNAMEHVAGFCAGLDMTTRGPEERSMRKSIDTYSVLGPWLATADEVPDSSILNFRLTVNGEERQKANTKDLVIDIPHLIEFASSFYTLHPGDLIYTGTPEGVGTVNPGDTIVMELDNVGNITVKVQALGAA
ncbi:fumarylacetoacetate hydrolase family protein [Advenella mimigardefordensis]|jgi:2-keto-4-pentenoate hydratase/2-oxohepta-3-ene-1,7-dioic acid hydratase in catechol pathway|uniref:Fumarylacetoacetate hydrolase domain-containing protein n=1 Tax=Advenella mimigardefordensis (strain DSM 17166 / LMG 22922 / DPN7) TaxID=1247726 RepID=W0PJH6_ADVMD|nr:fumarylacetoacetate hydrolase family protein [Advenella mimigardefordensis]AHG66177.1 fumarylacetoacetate hydrolase domain-containing protein [Advenella mimigardefordensis DPN7]